MTGRKQTVNRLGLAIFGSAAIAIKKDVVMSCQSRQRCPAWLNSASNLAVSSSFFFSFLFFSFSLCSLIRDDSTRYNGSFG